MDSKRREQIETVCELTKALFRTGAVEVAAPSDLIGLIDDALRQVSGTPVETLQRAMPVKPSRAQIQASIQPDALISFENGRRYRVLRRHLHTLGLTPELYRQRWGLPADYPMVAPSYSELRSEMARAVGLGKRVRPRSRRV